MALAHETSPVSETFCEMRNSSVTNSFSQNFRFFFPSLASESEYISDTKTYWRMLRLRFDGQTSKTQIASSVNDC